MTVRVGEPRTGPREFGITQSGQFFPQGGIGSDEDGFELVDGLGAGFDGRRLREFVHSRDLHRPVARFGPGVGSPAQYGSRRVLGIERIRFAAPTAICPVHPVHVEHAYALSQQIARQGRPVGAGPLHSGPPHGSRLPGPLEQIVVSSRGGRELVGGEDCPHHGEHRSHMRIPVRVHSQNHLPRGAATAGLWSRRRTGHGRTGHGRTGHAHSPSGPLTCRVAGTGPRRAVRIVRTPQRSAGP